MISYIRSRQVEMKLKQWEYSHSCLRALDQSPQYVSVFCTMQQIDSLSPEELRDRIEDLDVYLKEIDGVDENFIDDDVDLDDYMSALDADIANTAEKNMDLPVAPVTVPSVSKSVKQVDESNTSIKVVEMEQNNRVCQQFNRNDSS